MALIRTGDNVSEFDHYRLSDYEADKKAYLQGIESEGQAIITQARKKAGDILKEAYKKGREQAEAEVQRTLAEAKEKGHQEGLIQGKKEGFEQESQKAQTDLAPLGNQLKKLIEEFEKQSRSTLEGAEAHLIDAALQLARSVTKVECDLNPEVLKARLTNAIKLLSPGMTLTVTLHPELEEQAKTYLGDLLQTEGLSPSVTWNTNPSLDSGSLRVQSGDSSVAFSEELQWESLLRKMKGGGSGVAGE